MGKDIQSSRFLRVLAWKLDWLHWNQIEALLLIEQPKWSFYAAFVLGSLAESYESGPWNSPRSIQTLQHRHDLWWKHATIVAHSCNRSTKVNIPCYKRSLGIFWALFSQQDMLTGVVAKKHLRSFPPTKKKNFFILWAFLLTPETSPRPGRWMRCMAKQDSMLRMLGSQQCAISSTSKTNIDHFQVVDIPYRLACTWMRQRFFQFFSFDLGAGMSPKIKFATKNQPLEFLLKTTLDTCLIQPIKQSPSTERTNPMPFSSKETSTIFHYIHGQNTVDGRNPAPDGYGRYPIIYRLSYMLGGWCNFFPSTVWHVTSEWWFPTLDTLLWKQFLLLHFEVATCWPCWGNTPPPKMDSM